MFRTEERNHLKPGGVGQNVDGAAPLRIEARVIGDQADVLAAKRREFLRFENIETGLHAYRAIRVFPCRKHWSRPNREQRDEDCQIYQTKVRPLESSQRLPPLLKPYNDILERAGRSCVESAMCVCYV